MQMREDKLVICWQHSWGTSGDACYPNWAWPALSKDGRDWIPVNRGILALHLMENQFLLE